MLAIIMKFDISVMLTLQVTTIIYYHMKTNIIKKNTRKYRRLDQNLYIKKNGTYVIYTY